LTAFVSSKRKHAQHQDHPDGGGRAQKHQGMFVIASNQTFPGQYAPRLGWSDLFDFLITRRFDSEAEKISKCENEKPMTCLYRTVEAKTKHL
jgi:hypothetical protein